MPAYLTPTPILSYRTDMNDIIVTPFVITADSAYQNCFEKFYQRKMGIYETEGDLFLGNLYNNLVDIDKINKSFLYFPSEWIARNVFLPAHLLGSMVTEGIAISLRFNPINSIVVGWETALCNVHSVMNPVPFQDQENPLTETFINQFSLAFATLSKADKINNFYYQTTRFSDQNIFIRYEYATDFIAKMRRIKGSVQGGILLPTAPENVYTNPASFPIGINGFYGAYGTVEIDFLLKEDINLGGFATIIGQHGRTKFVRIPSEGVPATFGVIMKNCKIDPGMTILASFYLSFEGLRSGLGIKGSYESAFHRKDSYTLITPDNSVSLSQLVDKSLWAQEHISVTIFYDWMREISEHKMEPFLGFSVQIPTQIFTGYGATKSYVLSLTFECLF